MAKIALKFTTMVGKIFKYQYPQMTKIGFKFSTMVGEIFKYLYSQMAKIVYLTNLSITCFDTKHVLVPPQICENYIIAALGEKYPLILDFSPFSSLLNPKF